MFNGPVTSTNWTSVRPCRVHGWSETFVTTTQPYRLAASTGSIRSPSLLADLGTHFGSEPTSWPLVHDGPVGRGGGGGAGSVPSNSAGTVCSSTNGTMLPGSIVAGAVTCGGRLGTYRARPG